VKKLFICLALSFSVISVGIGAYAMPQPMVPITKKTDAINKNIHKSWNSPAPCNLKGSVSACAMGAVAGAANGAVTGAGTGPYGTVIGAVTGAAKGAIIGGITYHSGCGGL
jgi:hypothetical protein